MYNYSKKKNKKVFAKILPILGNIANVLAIFSGAFITFMALRIANNSSEQNSSSSIILSAFGAGFSSIMTLIMYIYSGANKLLIEIGKKADKCLVKSCDKKNNALVIEKENKKNCSSCSYKGILYSLVTVGSVSCVLSNTVINGIKEYQEATLLVDRFLNLYDEMSPSQRETYYGLLKWFVVNMYVFTFSYSAIAFQGGFADQLIKAISKKLYLVDEEKIAIDQRYAQLEHVQLVNSEIHQFGANLFNEEEKMTPRESVVNFGGKVTC